MENQEEIFLFSIKKSNKRYEIGIREKETYYYFTISEDLLIESRFLNYRALSRSEYQAFLNKIPLDSLVYEGEKYLDRKVHSEKEVNEHLHTISSSDTLVESAIKILKNKNLIDDSAFLNSYLDYAINTKRDGILKIKQQLLLYGLDSPYVVYPETALKDNIRYLTKKYNDQSRDLPKKAKIDKIKNSLLSRGYTDDQISHYLDTSLIKGADEKKIIKKAYDKALAKFEGDQNKIKEYLKKKGFSMTSIIDEGGDRE